MNETRAIFVTGLHRSGTSLLHFLVGACPGYIALGEISTFISSRENLANASQGSCSCGVAITHCPFWSGVLPRLEGDGDYTPVLEHCRAHFPGRIPVDSSKHLCALERLPDARVLLSIRDVRGWSVSVGRPTVRGFRNWYRRNLELRNALEDRQYLMVSYDELALRPERSNRRLRSFLGAPAGTDAFRTGSFAGFEHHAVHVNQMKDQPAKMAAIQYDYRWFDDPRVTLPSLLLPRVMRFNRENVYGYVHDDFVRSAYSR